MSNKGDSHPNIFEGLGSCDDSQLGKHFDLVSPLEEDEEEALRWTRAEKSGKKIRRAFDTLNEKMNSVMMHIRETTAKMDSIEKAVVGEGIETQEASEKSSHGNGQAQGKRQSQIINWEESPGKYSYSQRGSGLFKQGESEGGQLDREFSVSQGGKEQCQRSQPRIRQGSDRDDLGSETALTVLFSRAEEVSSLFSNMNEKVHNVRGELRDLSRDIGELDAAILGNVKQTSG